ncbi:MAG: GHKL domain-containing protein [Anaerolineaceae bacterium]|nr:GHKL domain-containing protein [Anaerolineaceae bacterium]
MTTLTQADPFDTKSVMTILDTIKSPIILLDQNQHLIALNQHAQQLFNLTATTIDGKTLTDLPNGEELNRLFDNNNTVREWTVDDHVYTPVVEAAPHGWTILLNDVSNYKRLNNSQSESMRYLLHDLRSPLTAIQGFASMMNSVGELNEKQEHFINKILSGVAQMTALVENVQDAGRYDPDTGSYQLMRVPTDIGHIVRKIVDNHLVPAEKTLSVDLSLAENLPVINADETMLQRAINNLVDNAIKYTPDGGEIHVSVTCPDKMILVAVEDTGLGISPENQAQLFNRHARIHRQEFKKIKGTGLGLFIVRSVAKRHGGDAWVKSEEGQGSTFYISIPLVGANLLSFGE